MSVRYGKEGGRIFVSGPITGKENLNREAFNAEEILLLEAGHTVFTPFHITPPDETTLNFWERLGSRDELEWQYFMRVCVGQIPLCDGMRMLPDWQNSKGSVWEHRIAKMLGLEVTYCYVPDPNPKW